MTSRDLQTAREAFIKRDVEKSIQAHQLSKHKENHKDGGEKVKSLVYGGLDGLLTTFAIVSGSIGANIGIQVIIILGVSNSLGDALSMAFGDYLGSKTEQEFIDAERERETWEVENNPEGELKETEELFVAQGISLDDSKTMATILSKYKTAWINHMMNAELGFGTTEVNSVTNGLVTFFSFLVMGFFPILPFIAGYIFGWNIKTLWILSIIVTALALFCLGAIKSKFTNAKFWKSGLETLIVGALAASGAFIVGNMLAPLTEEKS